MYAVIVTGGKQYRVSEGDTLLIEKLDANAEDTVEFDQVLAVGKEDGVVVGAPTVEGAKVTAKVVDHILGDKIVVFKHKRRKAERRTQGHRQEYTVLTVTGIVA